MTVAKASIAAAPNVRIMIPSLAKSPNHPGTRTRTVFQRHELGCGMAWKNGQPRFRFPCDYRARGSRQRRVDRLDQLDERRSRQRRREYEALRRADAVIAQIHHLLEMLHAFSDDLHAQVARKVHQGLDDRLRMG